MTEQQIPKLAAALVEHQAAFAGLTTEEAQWVITQTTAAIAVMVAAVKAACAKLNRLLERVGEVLVSATITPFVVKDKFVLDASRKAKVKISYLSDNFKVWFGGNTEDPIGEQTLRYAKLCEDSVDGSIITELGGEAKAETTLSEMFYLMEKQKNGESGALLNNGYANIFYIKDQNGVLRAVDVYWLGDGWVLDARSVVGPFRWVGGRRVFSRKALVSSETLVPAQA